MKRITAHNGRVRADGAAYSARHNDRNKIKPTDHIHTDRSQGNRYYNYLQDDITFEQAEERFYQNNFDAYLAERNAKAIKQRHPERIQTMDQYRTSRKSCPEEQIIAIGNKEDTIDPNLLWKIACRQIIWEAKTYPQCHVVDVALHVDEEGAPHIHKRCVWVAHDHDGNRMVNQKQALREMGIERPNTALEEGRYNNAKMTYTNACRGHLVALAREYGIEIEDRPKEASQSGLSLTEFKAAKTIKRLHNTKNKKNRIAKEVRNLQAEAQDLYHTNEQLKEKIKSKRQALDKIMEYQTDDKTQALVDFCRELQMNDGQSVLDYFEELYDNRIRQYQEDLDNLDLDLEI